MRLTEALRLIILAIVTGSLMSGCAFVERLAGPADPEDLIVENETAPGLLPTISPADTTHPFERETYMTEWARELGECLDTRDKVLIEESLEPVTFVTDAQCVVHSGLWIDIYAETADAARVTDPDELIIDHIVSLEEAHRSGAWEWNAKRRNDFANDLGNLTAVRRSSAAAKAGKDVTYYLPPNPDTHCAFILSGILTKRKWALTMDEDEATEVRKFDALCDFQGMQAKLGEAPTE